MSIAAAHRTVALHGRGVRAKTVDRYVNAFKRLVRYGVYRDPFNACVLRAQALAKKEEESDALHFVPL
jgi:hypothetical protein